jgi:hypothetical protein
MSTTHPEGASMSDVTAVVDGYLDAYNERDRARREERIAQVWAGDGALIDPPLTGEGHGGISDLAEAMHAHYAGHTFRRVTGIDVHHGHLRYAWELVDPEGAVVLSGVDVGELAEDGRLRRIVGFFGELPPRDGA